jgi:hypothetical protein
MWVVHPRKATGVLCLPQEASKQAQGRAENRGYPSYLIGEEQKADGKDTARAACVTSNCLRTGGRPVCWVSEGL